MIADGAIGARHASGGNAGRAAALAASLALHGLVIGLLARNDAPVLPLGEEAAVAILAVEIVADAPPTAGDAAAQSPSFAPTEPSPQDPATDTTPAADPSRDGQEQPAPPVRTASDDEDREDRRVAVEPPSPVTPSPATQAEARLVATPTSSDAAAAAPTVAEAGPAPVAPPVVERARIEERPARTARPADAVRRNDGPPKRSRRDEPPRDRRVLSDAMGTSADPGAKRGNEAASTAARAGGVRTNDVLAAYLASVRVSIVTQRRPRTAGESGRVVVRFDVERTGGLSGVSIVDDGARFDLREEALRLVRRASPVAPIPSAIARDRLPMTVTLKFE